MGSDSPLGSFRDVVRPLWKELSNSFSALGMQRRAEDEEASRHANAMKNNLASVPSTSILERNPQIVVGVLFKFVNLAWRPRLFVLQNGVLKYFKVYGPTRVNVYLLLESLRQQGELFPIGAEVSVLEAQDERACTTSGLNGAASRSDAPPAPRAEIHMQVGSVRESNADGRKFYVHSGTTTLTLRTETQDDRWVWLEALKAAKGAWDGLTPTAAGALTHITPRSSLNADRRFHSIVAEVRERLARMGTSAEAQAYVTSVLEQQHQEFHELALADENKRHSLLDIIYQLENEKRQLETALVVEGRTAADRSPHAASIGSLATAGAEFAEAGAVPGSSEADDDNSGQQGPPSTGSTGGLDRLDSMGGQLHEEEEEEEFFECDTVSLRSHSRSTSMTDLAELLEAASVSPPASGDAGSGAPPAEKARAPPSGAVAVAAGAANGVSAHAPTPRDVSASVPEWLAAESAPQRRTHLPPPLQREKSISLWALIKEMVGKDLTRVCLPVYFNEPLSALEKTAEDLEYSELLDQAAALPPGSVDRLLRIAAFAVSAYSSTVGRIAKPFNPLLGETYELVHPEKGFRFVSEKVSHHPTIIAAHAEGRGWTFEGDAEVKSKFWGRSIELKPEGVLRLQFADGDTYVWNKVTTSINNLILGKIYVDHGGIMRVRNLRPGGLTARIRFKETGMLFDKDPRQVKGFLERGGQRLERPMLFGHWDDAVCAELEDGSTIELWKKAPPPPDPTRYNLTQFAIQLNELTPGLRDKIAPTDCRLRPDQAFTERGMWDEANAEKQRLEHKQRAARRAADRGDPIRPRWFTVLPAASAGAKREAHELAFQYNGGYWEARAEGRYDGCRDIFGQHVEGE